MGLRSFFGMSSKTSDDSSLVKSPGSSGSETEGGQQTASQSPQTATDESSDFDLVDITDGMSEDQEAVYETYNEDQQIDYRDKTSRMSDENIENYNALNLVNYDVLLSSVMSGGQRVARALSKDEANEVSLKLFGYYGGTFGRYKSSSLGYKLRDVIKEQARVWARKQVDEEFQEKAAEVSGAQDEAVKVEELEIRKRYLNAFLYQNIKDELEKKIKKEADDLAVATETHFGNDLDTAVKNKAVADYKSYFSARMKKNSKLSGQDKINTSRIETMEYIAKTKESIGSTVYNTHKSELRRYTTESGQQRRDAIIVAIGGTISSGKPDFSQMNTDGLKAAEYLYSDGTSSDEGVASIEEKRQEITAKMSNNEIVSPDISNGLTRYSMFIMNTVPADGDKADASATIKIPVYQGVSLNFSIGGENEREKQYVTSKVNIGIGASGDVGIANITGEIGGFIETKAKTPENMATLISYVMYRKARESSIFPTDLTNVIWGMGGRTGDSKFKEAETFGAMAEKRLFGEGSDEENSATHGGYGKLSVELGDMDKGLGGEIEVEGTAGREYSQESFKEGHSGAGRLGRVGAYQRFGQKSKGDRVETISIEGAIGGLGLKGTAGASVKFRGTTFEEFSISGSGSFMIPMDFTGGLAVGMLSQAIGDLLVNYTKIKKGTDRILASRNVDPTESNFDNDFQNNVEKAQAGSELALSYVALATTGLTDSFGASQGIQLSFDYTKSSGEPGEFSISLETLKSLGIDLEVFEMEINKTSRIAKWSTGSGWEN